MLPSLREWLIDVLLCRASPTGIPYLFTKYLAVLTAWRWCAWSRRLILIPDITEGDEHGWREELWLLASQGLKNITFPPGHHVSGIFPQFACVMCKGATPPAIALAVAGA